MVELCFYIIEDFTVLAAIQLSWAGFGPSCLFVAQFQN